MNLNEFRMVWRLLGRLMRPRKNRLRGASPPTWEGRAEHTMEDHRPFELPSERRQRLAKAGEQNPDTRSAPGPYWNPKDHPIPARYTRHQRELQMDLPPCPRRSLTRELRFLSH